MAPLSGTCTPLIKLRGCSVKLQGSLIVGMGTQDTLVFLICVMRVGVVASFSKETRLIVFYKIINGLAQVPFESILIEAYKGTRRK